MQHRSAAYPIETPGILFDIAELKHCARRVRSIVRESGGRLLYAVKACHTAALLEVLSDFVDGFSASSVFEAMISRQFCATQQSIHLTNPGLRESDFNRTVSLCDYVSFNSLGQLRRSRELATDQYKIGLRINPGVSFLTDRRYDPCRRRSKLGVPLDEIATLPSSCPLELGTLTGLLVHNNCDSDDFSELLETVRALDERASSVLSRVRWINLGGGYLYSAETSIQPYLDAVDLLQSKYALDVFVEPGAAFVRSSGSLVSAVVDIFERDGRLVAVLDTSVNHLPEVFEYQFEPDVEGHVENGRFTYLLAGCSCLAGDLFGVYSFDEPLEVGSRVVFRNAGAYSIVKAHMFNGINLPNIYLLTEKDELVLVKRFTYEDFASRCGVDTRAIV